MNLEQQILFVNLSAHGKQINRLVNEIIVNHPDLNTNVILSKIKCYSDELPRPVREVIYDFKLKSTSKILILNLDLDQYTMGPTPSRIAESTEKLRMTPVEILHTLVSSALGEIFTWSSIQNSNLVNEVFPIKENMNKPISSGANNIFDLHTEDAFHPLMGEYLSLLCLRNPNNVSTTLSSIDISEISEKISAVLFEERFLIGANIAHEVNSAHPTFSILFGNQNYPFLRINLNNVDVERGDDEAKNALNTIRDILQRNLYKYPMKTGDLMFIDNFRVVHGRDIYAPKYDGTDRWLKRLYLTNDLRKSSEYRLVPDSRIINVS